MNSNLKNDFSGSKLIFYDKNESSNRLGDFLIKGKKIDKTSIFDFLLFGTILPPHSPLAGVSHLFPGEQINSENEYSKLNLGKETDMEKIITKFDNLLEEIIAESGVKTVLLSGGIDSAILLSYLKGKTACITWGGWGESTDDVIYSKVSAKKFGVKEHYFVYADYEKDFELYKEALQRLKIPILFNNSVPFLRMSLLAKEKGINNWLMGQNADTLFMAYPAPILTKRLLKINNFLPLDPFFFLKTRKKYLFSTSSLISIFAYFKSLGVFPGKWINIPEGYFEEKELILKNYSPPGADLDQKIILTEEILTEARRNQICQSEIPSVFGIEVNCPYFDKSIISLALSVSSKLRKRGGYNKLILKKLAKKRGVPDAVIYKKKSGLSYGYKDIINKKIHLPIWDKMEKNDYLNYFINIKEIRRERQDNFYTFVSLSSLHYWFELVACPNNLTLE